MHGKPELDSSTLRRLYVDEGLTDTAIAKLYSTHQPIVSKLRKKYGIVTIARTDRLQLPESFTDLQRSLLVGSMLGDAGLRATGSRTARLHEHHSAAQKGYLDWKVSEWGPWVSSASPSDKGDFLGFQFHTHGARVFYPYWQQFYPSGSGSKVFSKLDPGAVDAFALAVWYMDDGSHTSSYVRFSVGPDDASTRIQLRILQRFKLEAHRYGEGGETSLYITDRGSITRFIDLVSPYIIPCMAYKLDIDLRKLGPAPRQVLTLERLVPLQARGLSAGEIGEILGVSRQSVGRALVRLDLPRRAPGRPSQDSRTEYDVETATRLLGPAPTFDDAFKVLARTVIPLPQVTQEDLEHDANVLRKAPTRLVDGQFQHVSRAGAALCNGLFQYRMEARYRDQVCARSAWYDLEKLATAIKFQLRVGDPLLPHRVFRAIQAVVRAPTNFRPALAKAIVEAFCPSDGLVLDPCAGYGGRAAGTLAAGRSYVGVEPHSQAPETYAKLHGILGGSFRLINQPFEDADLGGLQADLVFTSPPYFSVERYSDDTSQSWVRYKTWEAWLDGFLKPMVWKSWEHLKLGGVFCVNTKNIRSGKRIFAIGDELVRLAKDRGFEHQVTLELPLGRLGKDVRTEPLFVFRR